MKHWHTTRGRVEERHPHALGVEAISHAFFNLIYRALDAS